MFLNYWVARNKRLYLNQEMEISLKRKKSSSNRAKVTISLDKEFYKLYHDGAENGWDTAELAKDAIESALEEQRNNLRLKAQESA